MNGCYMGLTTKMKTVKLHQILSKILYYEFYLKMSLQSKPTM